MVKQSGSGVTGAGFVTPFRGKSYDMGERRSLTVPGRYDKIREVCKFVAEGARRAGFDKDARFQVELACDEACTNIIEHTYQAENVGDITIEWELGRRTFVVTIKDHGERFDPSDIPPAPVPPDPLQPDEEDENEMKVGGLGVYLMRQLMDRVAFSYNEGTGNVLTMEKELPDSGER